jgi:hypothetical protein
LAGFQKLKPRALAVAGNLLSAEVSYALNGGGVYSGNSMGFAAHFVAGTLVDAPRQTAPGVFSGYDNYSAAFVENYGFEVYAGVKFVNKGRFIVGFNTNKGLAMNTTLENKADGQIKYRQLDTSNPSNDIFETSSLFLKFVMAF